MPSSHKNKKRKSSSKDDSGEHKRDKKNNKMEVDIEPKKEKEMSWGEKVMEKINYCNSFHMMGTQACPYPSPFVLCGKKIGLITEKVIRELEKHPTVFQVVRDLFTNKVKFVTMSPDLKEEEERSRKFDNILREWKKKELSKERIFKVLKGWTGEQIAVKDQFSGDTLLKCEKVASSLFGFRTYGVHINGYVRNDQGEVYMWIARRSAESTPEIFAQKLDNTVAGSIECGYSILDTVTKECKQAGILADTARQARPAGIISYCCENAAGISPETQYVYDLELPRSFEPTPDLEKVQEYYLLPVKEVKELIATNEFKPNCALVLLDFFIRHGAIDPDTEPKYLQFSQGCRQSTVPV